MVFICRLTHDHQDASGCGYMVPLGRVRMVGRGSDYVLVFAGKQHKLSGAATAFVKIIFNVLASDFNGSTSRLTRGLRGWARFFIRRCF